MRLGAGMTQQQAAELLHMRQQSYARYENGQGEPNLETLVTLTKIFGVTSDYLLGISDY